MSQYCSGYSHSAFPGQLGHFSDQGFNPSPVEADLTWKDGLKNPEIVFSDTDARFWVNIWEWLFWAAADRWPNNPSYAPLPWTGVPRLAYVQLGNVAGAPVADFRVQNVWFTASIRLRVWCHRARSNTGYVLLRC